MGQSNSTSGTKIHSPSTSKKQTYALPSCSLTKIEIKCSHAKEEKKTKDVAPHSQAGSSQSVAEVPHSTEPEEEGGRILTIPGDSAAGKEAPAHPVPVQTVSADETPTGNEPTETPQIKGEIGFNKAIIGVVPSGRKVTKPTPISILGGAIVFDLEHAEGLKKTGDKVKFTADVKGKCSRHPLWTITGGDKPVPPINKDPLEYEFLPPEPDGSMLSTMFHAWWLKDIKPRQYEVLCKTCKGSDNLEPITINVYPNMSSSVAVTFNSVVEQKEKGHHDKAHSLSEMIDELTKALKVIKDEFEVEPAKYIEWPAGKIKLSNNWEEDEKSLQAYWGGTLEIGLNPLIGLHFHVTLIPALALRKFVPKFVRKYANVDVYLDVAGGLKLTTAFDWRLKSDQKMHVSSDMKKAMGGDIKLEIGAEVFVGKKTLDEDDTFLYGTLHGNTGIGAEGGLKFTDEGEVELEGELSWDGISVTAKITFLNVLWQKHRIKSETAFEVVKGGKTKTSRILLMKKEPASESP